MFNNSKYTRWYEMLTERAKTRTLTGYIERHHILPRSLGGDDTDGNVVALTAKEHFICHLLLTKMTTGAEKHKMIKAARMMAFLKGPGQQRYKISAKTYSMIKTDAEVPEETRDRMSVAQKIRFETSIGTFNGRHHSDETKEKIRATRIGKKDSEITRNRKSNSAKNRPPVKDETRLKLSVAGKGRDNSGEKNGFYGKTHTEEYREIKRQEKLNTPRHTCPHCSKIVDSMNYARWHGDKCKNRI